MKTKEEILEREFRYRGKLEAYHELIKEYQMKALKLETVIALDAFDNAFNRRAKVIHLTKEAEEVLDNHFLDLFLFHRNWSEKPLDAKEQEIYDGKQGIAGAYRYSEKTFFGLEIVWDAEYIIVDDLDSIPGA